MIILLAAILGLLVGSFLNVVIYRLPEMLEAGWQAQCQELANEQSAVINPSINLLTPASHCPHCQAPVRWWQNVPLLSYMILRGKCHACQVSISIRYPFVELLSAVLSGVLAWHFGVNWMLLGALLFTWILIACFWIDYDHQLLPDALTLLLLWIGLLFNLREYFATLESAVIGAMAGYLFFWGIYWLFKLFTGKEGLGYGDFKLLAALGAWLGWQYLPLIVLISGVLSIVIAIGLRCFQSRELSKPMAYGPSLVIAGWVTLVWGQTLMNAYITWALHG